ncbi:DUF3231 family protein [Halobacillus karajensis]|uniref:DUF3231 family protein n=1 Tax=Halobacillus karajensis TaxID=195088 RepID=A0A059NW71_9BACI|nr:DUF3231 family protein [Halobacillus karajensis]CDQ20886.1 hypothetical protein BN982_03241 [Halobacillus karajensis]CDQ23644.1 hypothetical protein BN983_01895 [Halobacillus karajensis]CDQ27122.1 hypothetical protein BN981_01376 [Halobacillus karajensis]
MEEKINQIRLTSAELGQLWTQYLNDSASVCFLTYFAEKAEDSEIKNIVEHALKLSEVHIQKITSIFNEESHAIPNGFKIEEDVDLTAPRLYSDSFVLNFVHNMAKIGLTSYSGSLSVAVREDITEFYMDCLSETKQLYKMSKDLLLSKGLYIRAPYFPNLEHNEFVKKQGFLWDVFGEKRPLIALEVSNLYSNVQRNAIGAATLVGFSQVAQDEKVKQFLLRGIKIARKHIKSFGSKLEESYLTIPMTWDTDITNNTTETFSDKIMMFYTSGLIALSIGYYGISLAQSPRVDIGILYNKLSVEIQLYSEDGANIMIQNKWLEQPPMASDRDELARKNNPNM